MFIEDDTKDQVDELHGLLDELPSGEGPLELAEGTPAPESSPEKEEEGVEDKDKKPNQPEVPEGEEEDPVDLKNIPFNKHPRFKKLVNDNRTLREQLDAMNQRLEELSAKGSQPNPDPKSVSIPTWFSSIYGHDPEIWAEYQKHNAQEREEIKAQILREVREEQEKLTKSAAEHEQKLQEWLDGQFEALEEEGHQFDRKELEKVMREYQPSTVDAQGNPVLDFKKGIQLLNIIKAQTAKAELDAKKQEARKAAAAKTKPSGSPATPSKPALNLRNRSFHELAAEDD